MDVQSKRKLISECLALVEHKPPEVELSLVNNHPVSAKHIFISFSHKKTPKVT